MGGITGERARQDLQAQAIAVHAAAGAVGQRHYAVHVRERSQGSGVAAAREVVGNGARGRGRAVHAGQHTDVVARGHTAVGAFDAHERGFAFCGGWFHLGTKGVVARKVAFVRAHVEVVGVHMFALGNGLAGEADDLVVAAHGGALCNGMGRDLVAGWHEAAHGEVLDGGAAHQLAAGDHHVISGVQADKGGHCGFLGVNQ